ncbi:MAG: patatin-like phospholipase family protein [Flavobacteriales bacterium]|nr:patatin-like phospholipase family protein [Flavobacteriales bacterium]
MNAHVSRNKRKNRVIYFFPIQLLLLHLKKNHFLLFVWVFLFSIITGGFGKSIGVPQQFLVPEYLGATGILSFAILGFAFGGFVSGYNLYTYIMHGYRFPFIATLSKPFHKFCMNNFLLPGIFLITFIFFSAKFQYERELVPPGKVVLNLISFLVAFTIFQSMSYVYFMYTNKDAKNFGKGRRRNPQRDDSPVDTPIHHPIKWVRERLVVKKWYVETYVSSFRRISLARDCQHYSREVLQKVFAQNHINASRFELVLLISFLLLGSLRSFEVFIIPAAASAMLFFTMLIMTISALHSWFRGWTLTVFILFFALLNLGYDQLKFARQSTKAYGLNYEAPPAIYDPAQLEPDRQTIRKDEAATIEILNKWKLKTGDTTDVIKPKLIIFNHSGGGSRSAYWTMRAVTFADSICQGELLNNTFMVTGASGGMVGAAYLRELMLQHAWDPTVNIYDQQYADNMSKDLLNPILLSATTNDWFIRYQRLYDGQYAYSKDRATAFEEQLARNTHKAFNRRLGDYTHPEKEAIIPMMIFTPTIVNDGRRLVIASQPVSYLTASSHANGNHNDQPEDIEFTRMFAAHDPMNLHFSSALRMNATFPYVTPMTTLPSEPELEVLDAGIRDNFGMKTTMQFLYTFREWINLNTSGVIIVQVRDLPKNKDLSDKKNTLFGKFSGPIGGIYGNITKTHDYNSEQSLRYLQGWFGEHIHLVTFELEQSRDSHISLSWHLTKSEKQQIQRSVYDEKFTQELKRLQELLQR